MTPIYVTYINYIKKGLSHPCLSIPTMEVGGNGKTPGQQI